LARSPGLVRAVHSVEHLVLLLAQLLVAVAATLAGYLLLDQYYGDAVSTLAAPCALRLRAGPDHGPPVLRDPGYGRPHPAPVLLDGPAGGPPCGQAPPAVRQPRRPLR
ncbi:unnamed protein product, partial [Heterosigma akashiwo]